MTCATGTRFQRDTAVHTLEGGRFAVRLDEGRWIVNGPNGGYVAALMLCAILAHLDDPLRTPRSLTVHFLRPPGAGDAVIAVTLERSGRSLWLPDGTPLARARQLALLLPGG
jgi:hypothetical protein